MNDLEVRLEAEYESALDTEEPPCGVDLELARANGRASRRRRRTAVTGSGLLVAALWALIAAGLLPMPGFGHGQTGTASDGGNYSGESRPPANDPLAARIAFGWLPDGVSVTGTMTQHPDIGTVTAGGAGMLFTASVLVRGQHWATSCSTNVTVIIPSQSTSGVQPQPGAEPCDPPAPTVNGRTAYWLRAPGSPGVDTDGVALRWQYADDAWAELDAHLPVGVNTASVAELLHRIAQNMHVSRYQAVPMPFHVGKLPAGWTFQYANWSGGAQGHQAGASADERHGSSPVVGLGMTGPDSSNLQVLASQAAGSFPTTTELKSTAASAAGEVQTLTVDGHQARLLTESDHETLIVHDVNGFDDSVEVAGRSGFALAESAGGIVGYYHTITFFGVDRATWTTHVLD